MKHKQIFLQISCMLTLIFGAQTHVQAKDASGILDDLKQYEGEFEDSGPRGIRLKGKQTLAKNLAKKYARTDAVDELVTCLTSNEQATSKYQQNAVPLSWVCSEVLTGLAYYMPTFKGKDLAKGWQGYVDLPAKPQRMQQSQQSWHHAMKIGRVRIPMNESSLKLKPRPDQMSDAVVDGDVIVFEE